MKKLIILILAMSNLNARTAIATNDDEEFDELSRTEIAVKDEALSSSSLTAGERSTKVLERAKKIQLALYALKCGKPTLVSPLSNPYKPAGPQGDTFSVTSKDCKILKKNEASCESGYEARGLPENLGAAKYQVCLKQVGTPAKPSAVTGTAGLE